jgi:hypothetical protein
MQSPKHQYQVPIGLLKTSTSTSTSTSTPRLKKKKDAPGFSSPIQAEKAQAIAIAIAILSHQEKETDQRMFLSPTISTATATATATATGDANENENEDAVIENINITAAAEDTDTNTEHKAGAGEEEVGGSITALSILVSETSRTEKVKVEAQIRLPPPVAVEPSSTNRAKIEHSSTGMDARVVDPAGSNAVLSISTVSELDQIRDVPVPEGRGWKRQGQKPDAPQFEAEQESQAQAQAQAQTPDAIKIEPKEPKPDAPDSLPPTNNGIEKRNLDERSEPVNSSSHPHDHDHDHDDETLKKKNGASNKKSKKNKTSVEKPESIPEEEHIDSSMHMKVTNKTKKKKKTKKKSSDDSSSSKLEKKKSTDIDDGDADPATQKPPSMKKPSSSKSKNRTKSPNPKAGKNNDGGKDPSTSTGDSEEKPSSKKKKKVPTKRQSTPASTSSNKKSKSKPSKSKGTKTRSSSPKKDVSRTVEKGTIKKEGMERNEESTDVANANFETFEADDGSSTIIQGLGGASVDEARNHKDALEPTVDSSGVLNDEEDGKEPDRYGEAHEIDRNEDANGNTFQDEPIERSSGLGDNAEGVEQNERELAVPESASVTGEYSTNNDVPGNETLAETSLNDEVSGMPTKLLAGVNDKKKQEIGEEQAASDSSACLLDQHIVGQNSIDNSTGEVERRNINAEPESDNDEGTDVFSTNGSQGEVVVDEIQSVDEDSTSTSDHDDDDDADDIEWQETLENGPATETVRIDDANFPVRSSDIVAKTADEAKTGRYQADDSSNETSEEIGTHDNRNIDSGSIQMSNGESPLIVAPEPGRSMKQNVQHGSEPSHEQPKKSAAKKTGNIKNQMLPINVPFSDDESVGEEKNEVERSSNDSQESADAIEDSSSPITEPEKVHSKSMASKRQLFDRRFSDSPSSVSSGPTGTPTRGHLVSPRVTKPQADWLSKKQADYLTAIATPRRAKRSVMLETPKGTPKRTINALNIASIAKNRSHTPPPRRSRKVFMNQDESAMLEGYIDSAISLLKDESKKSEVKESIHTIHMAKGFPRSRRLSMRDNELICNLIRAIQNDPNVTKIEVDCDSVFGTVQTTLLFNFIESLRLNLHLTTLQFRGVELGNDFLYGLASSLESNFALKHIDLSMNCFTSEGLAEFCKALGSLNVTCVEVNLKDQTTPISVASQEDVLDAFRQNKSLTNVQLDFQSEDGTVLLEKIMERNRLDQSEINLDEKVVEVFRDMADLARELNEQKKAEELVLQVPDDDWDYLHELAVLFEKHKLKKEIQAESDEISGNQKTIKENENLTGKKKSDFLFGKFRDILEESVSCFNSNGSFLTDEFIAKFLVDEEDTSAIVFDFHGQWKLFKRFPPQDPHRRLIVTKLVDAIVLHSRAAEFTGISMANTGCGDDFLVTLSERLIGDDSLLPNLQMLNFETNYINQTGVIALSKLIAHPTGAKYLQVVRLENQKGLLKSKAEVALMKALCVNRSVVVLGLRLRNLLETQQVGKYLVRNIDFIRQARQRHARVTGNQRKRNEVEQVFDSVADNDPYIDKVVMLDCKRFLTLTAEEKSKAAASLAHNSFVKVVNFNASGIDDEFAIELGKAIRTNETIEKLFLENNAISGEGVKALFEGLGQNKTIEEVRLHHQSKMIISADEDTLADALEPNTTIMKIGIDLRSKVAQIKLDRKLKYNRNNQLKRKAEAKQEDFRSNDSFAVLKF